MLPIVRPAATTASAAIDGRLFWTKGILSRPPLTEII